MQDSLEGEGDSKLKQGQQWGAKRAKRDSELWGRRGYLYPPPPKFLAVGGKLGADYPAGYFKSGPDYPSPLEKRLRIRNDQSGMQSVGGPDIWPDISNPGRIIRPLKTGRNSITKTILSFDSELRFR